MAETEPRRFAIRERPALPEEVCACGRPAVVVVITELSGEVGWCQHGLGGSRRTPEVAA